MAQAQCSAINQRPSNTFDAIGFSGVNSHREHLAGEHLKSFTESAWWESSFWTRNIESHNTLVAVTKSELGYFHTPIEVPHRRDELTHEDGRARSASSTDGFVNS